MSDAHREKGVVQHKRLSANRGWRVWLTLCVLGLLGAAAFLLRPASRTALRPDAPSPREPASKWLATARGPDTGQGLAALSGKVRTREGTAIRGARVCASCASCSAALAPPAICAPSDDAGVYALDIHDARGFVISAAASGFKHGYANAGRPVVPGSSPRTDLDITLSEGGARVQGIVVDALGGAVADARVQLLRFEASTWSTLEARSDAEGRFELWTGPGQIQLRAEASGYAPTLSSWTAPCEGAELRLTPASSVRGRVISAESGEPVAGVEVAAIPVGAAEPRTAGVISDEAGHFELPHLDPGRYTIVAESERWRGQARAEVELGLVEVVADVTVVVGSAVRLLGHVLVGRGTEPCPRGTVALEAAAPQAALAGPHLPILGLPSVATRIEADGSVLLKGLIPGSYQVIVQCLEHTLSEGPQTLEIGDKDLEIVWRTEPGIGLVVNAVDELTHPIPYARMFLYLPPQPRTGNQIAAMPITADAEGRAIVPADLVPGSHRVESADGIVAEPVSIELRKGAIAQEVTLRFKGSGSIVVEVVDAEGRGILGLQLSAREREVTPAPAQQPLQSTSLRMARAARGIELGGGRYRVGPMAAGTYTVELHDGVNPTVNAAGQEAASIEVRSGQTAELRLRLARSGRLLGRVVDDRGEPAGNVWVTAKSNSDAATASWLARTRGLPSRVMTDLDGEFVIEGLEPRALYTLEARQPHGSAAAVRDVAEGKSITLVLPASASIAGEVRDATGRPALGAAVQARHPDTDTIRSAPVSADGHFSIDRMPPGRVTLTAAGQQSVGHEELELRAGQALAGLRLTIAPPQQDSARQEGRARP